MTEILFNLTQSRILLNKLIDVLVKHGGVKLPKVRTNYQKDATPLEQMENDSAEMTKAIGSIFRVSTLAVNGVGIEVHIPSQLIRVSFAMGFNAGFPKASIGIFTLPLSDWALKSVRPVEEIIPLAQHWGSHINDWFLYNDQVDLNLLEETTNADN